MKLLFISRSYPPVIGGLEKHNYSIHSALHKKIKINALVNKFGKKVLPLFLPLCLVRALLISSKQESVLLGDGVLGIVGWFIKTIKPSVPVVCIIHGLDITYKNAFYQYFWVGLFLPKLDKIIAVSHATADAVISRGIPQSKLIVIPNGIYPLQNLDRNKNFLSPHLNIAIDNQIVLFTLGRLVKRKGINWFINHVFTHLEGPFIYIIAGDGPEKDAIEQSIIANQLTDKVFCLGSVTEKTKSQLFLNADLFIQPNIKVKGDMEGFGIAVLEANLHELPVLGSKLEGLKDSIVEGQNGWLIEPEEPSIFTEKILEVTQSKKRLKQAGQNAKTFCLQQFCWDKIADQYIEVFRELVKNNKK